MSVNLLIRLAAIVVLTILVGGMAFPLGAATPGDVVVIAPGQDIQKVVNKNLPGTSYLLRPGVHRLQSIQPKDGDSFTGEFGARMSGAVKLEVFARQDGYWRASAPSASAAPTGRCAKNRHGGDTDICTYLEDLFIDSKPLRRVAKRGAVKSGTWYFDYDQGVIYLTDNPRGRDVELSVTRHAFYGAARNVIISGLIIEKYASPAQSGAIQGDNGTAWTVRRNEIRLNHGAGIRTGAAMRIIDNRIHFNGQIGLVGKGDNIQIVGNVLAHNNYAGFSQSWEAGGAKLVKTTNLVVRDNCVHNNKGSGLWTDISNIHSLYEDNRVFGNAGEGIHHEISYDAVIRGNTVFDNGHGKNSWLFGAQIMISTSQNVEVYDNHVDVARGYGEGIVLIQQERGEGRYGTWKTSGNRVYDNFIIYRGDKGVSGAAGDFDNEALFSSGNHFDGNRYWALKNDESHWAWGEAIEHRARYRTWTELQESGVELAGRLEIKLAKTLARRCGKMAVGPKLRRDAK